MLIVSYSDETQSFHHAGQLIPVNKLDKVTHLYADCDELALIGSILEGTGGSWPGTQICIWGFKTESLYIIGLWNGWIEGRR